MASVSRDPSGKFRVQFVDTSGARQTLRLPTGDRRTAESIARHVEALLASRLSGEPLELRLGLARSATRSASDWPGSG